VFGRRVLVLLAALLAAGCGGRTGDDVESSCDDAGMASEVGPWGEPPDGGTWSVLCPDTQPATGGPCSGDVACEYGSAWWDVSCDTVMHCTSGAWAIDDVSSESCFPEPGANPTGCPIDPTTVRPESGCDTAAICYYGQGAFCECQPRSQAEDAGLGWICGPDPTCPSTRPRIGAPCGDEGLTCGYGDESGFEVECQSGAWTGGVAGGP
jgi:hypothetical protein